ncbi:MAG: tetratricopeptide repeat protein [Winogradskyella sp.]|uniref:tetratricopeptide repeat protein n=1 Tax=Winogradskyella sp. TaxID=1883156 RepID=UPI0025F16BB9|nr:tetratricopeptide repeat protein [Winogradskyella sp.]NRB82818.1 tetratricopeptide repeat protein [Winogradskyella sp.]
MKRYLLSVFIIVVVELVYGQTGIQQADEYYALGAYSKAIKTYKTLENEEGIYAKIAKAYIALGNYGEGLKYYEQAIALEPNNLKVRYDYAKLLMRTKKFEIAKNELIGLILNDSLNPNLHYELGIVLEKQHDTLSINSFKKAYEIDDSHQKAIFKIAKRHIFKRRFEQAHALIDKGLQNYSESIELISLKAQAYYFQEYYTHAVVWFNKLIDLGEA